MAECDADEVFIEKFSKQFAIKDKFRRLSVKKNVVKLVYEKQDVEIDLENGKGEIVSYNKTPFLIHFSKLHKDTSV